MGQRIMKIEVLKRKNNRNEVLCNSKYGKFLAYWNEDDAIENETYDVELDTEEELIWEINLFKAKEERCICNEDEKIKIVGNVESMDDDGCLTVRVETDALTFVTQSAEIEQGLVVKILLNHIKAYPIEY
jgi:hypothetical protein